MGGVSMKRIALFILLLGILIGLTIEVIAPAVIVKGVEMALKRTLNGDYSISLNAHPKLKMLTGRFENIYVKVNDVNVAGVKIDEVLTRVDDIKLNLKGFIMKRILDFEGGKDIKGEIIIGEKDLQDALNLEGNGFKDISIHITPEESVILASSRVFNDVFNLMIAGEFSKLSDKKIGFSIKEIMIENEPLPDKLQKKLLSGTVFYLDFTDIPGIKIQKVQAGDEKILIYFESI
jgi:hypothetical protein